MRQTNIDDFLNLAEHNKELAQIIEEEKRKSEVKDKILFQQNKMAALGEMLVNISHQWRQPLMEINSLFLPIEAKINLDMKIENDELIKTIKKLNEITSYMSNTIDDFRNFFVKDKEKIEFKLLEQINSTVNIISGSLKKSNIKLDILIQKNPTLIGYKNEYSQVLINIINNARDVLVQRNIENPYVKISIYEENNDLITTVEDNGRGISIRPIQKVFDPFFTYEKVNGTGIGLFMAKLIVENNMQGRLFADNTDEGALFKITIPKGE